MFSLRDGSDDVRAEIKFINSRLNVGNYPSGRLFSRLEVYMKASVESERGQRRSGCDDVSSAGSCSSGVGD